MEDWFCATCGDPIGDGQVKNAVYGCDETDGLFCGVCFAAVRCEERHGEGCATLIACAGPPPADPATGSATAKAGEESDER